MERAASLLRSLRRSSRRRFDVRAGRGLILVIIDNCTMVVLVRRGYFKGAHERRHTSFVRAIDFGPRLSDQSTTLSHGLRPIQEGARLLDQQRRQRQGRGGASPPARGVEPSEGGMKAKDDAALLLQKAASMHLGAVHKPPSESKKADHTQYSFAPNGRTLDEASKREIKRRIELEYEAANLLQRSCATHLALTEEKKVKPPTLKIPTAADQRSTSENPVAAALETARGLLDGIANTLQGSGDGPSTTLPPQGKQQDDNLFATALTSARAFFQPQQETPQKLQLSSAEDLAAQLEQQQQQAEQVEQVEPEPPEDFKDLAADIASRRPIPEPPTTMWPSGAAAAVIVVPQAEEAAAIKMQAVARGRSSRLSRASAAKEEVVVVEAPAAGADRRRPR